MNNSRKDAAVSLEPADWNQFRALGRKIVDDMSGYLESLRERPAWQPVPEPVRAQLTQPIPRDPTDPSTVYEEFRQSVLPFPRGNIHPRFWGWANGSGVPMAAYADFLATIMNGTVSSGESAGMLVEEQVIQWFKEMFDWPVSGSGLLTSGSSMGQIIGIAAARVAKANSDIRVDGARHGPQLTVYCSSETHLSVQKSVELLGLGSVNLRKIPVNSKLEIDIDQLEDKIREDRRRGYLPICVVGNVGTVNTGAIDPIGELVRIARNEDLWLHIDGAFGAFAYLLPSHRPLLSYLNEANSLVFDLHKWFFMPFDISCILVRHPHILEDTFSVQSAYTSKTSGGPASYPVSFADRGIEQTRPFRALKIWFTLKTYGLRAFTEVIARNIEQIHYLNRRIDHSPNLERISASCLNITCFRYVRENLTDVELNEINRKILQHLQVNGIAVPSHTILYGKFLIRVANNNHRSSFEDFDVLVDNVLDLGSRLVAAGNATE